MKAIETTAAVTLKEMRREVAGASTIYSERLRQETELSGAAGFSDMFMDACGQTVPGADAFRLGLEYIFEGYVLHYGQSRLLQPDSSNFFLLAGDHMYARGLKTTASLGDLDSIEALSELIRVCSFVHCEKLDQSVAAYAWAITTLKLAIRAAGLEEHAAAGLEQDATVDTPGIGALVWDQETGLETAFNLLLMSFPKEKAAGLRDLFAEINSNFRTEA